MTLLQNKNDITARLAESLRAINGIYAFMLADEARGQYWIARDPIGIIPLYYGYDSAGYLHVASEMKAFPADVIPHHFPPGHFMVVHNSDIGTRRPQPVKYYMDLDLDISTVRQFAEPMESQIEHYKLTVREALSAAVERQLMTDVPFGALLSGGLDSSLVCSIAVKALEKPSIRQSSHVTWDGQLRTFSIGLEGGNATDLEAAERAAKWLGTKHHNFTFTMDEGLAAIRDVIWHLETYDVTTIRASTPMFLLARKIKAMGIKMVLSGEGSDEIFGGYLYFLKAPNDEEHSRECVRRVGQLSLFDCLRANKSTMAWGVEARPPFLDTELVRLGLSMPACLKRYKGVEKWILRAAFDVKDPKTGHSMYLPDDLLWRQKEQFSDGVGYGWIDRLKAEAESHVSDYLLSLAPERFPVNTPVTKEEYHYRTIFEDLFPQRGREYTVQKWIPKTEWAGVGYDPSGRAQSCHVAALQ
jgi:asparagine synthase (glutamine-hydrolysing)